MEAAEFMKKMYLYRENADETGHRDHQYEKGYVTLKEKGSSDNYFILLGLNGAWQKLDYDLQVIEKHPECEAYLKLQNKDLERFSPYLCLGTGACGFVPGLDKSALEKQVKAGIEKILTAEKLQRKHFGSTSEKIFPAYTGDARNIRFYSSNGMEIRMFTPAEYRRMNDSRRFFSKKRLPVPQKTDSDFYFYIFVRKADLDRFGKNLEQTLKGALSEIRKYFELTDKLTFSYAEEEIFL